MKRDVLHNLLVAAYMAGIEKCMEPVPPTVQAAADKGHMGVVTAHLSGAARMYAERVLENPGTAVHLEQ